MCVLLASFFLLFHVVDDMVYHGTRLGYSNASCTKGKEKKKKGDVRLPLTVTWSHNLTVV